MNDDLTLLREFAEKNSEAAFTEIVSRHVNLVYSVALRQVRDTHLAEEITQAVFIILARKANSFGDKTILSGWLCRTARYASANALTIQRRRQQREQEAYMQNVLNEETNESALNENWNQIAPLLDAAMGKLGQKDHDALALRFFENKNFAEVGAAIGVNEDAAKMRVSRALEKLRKFFAKRGVSSTTAILAGAISANSVQAAPAALVKTIPAVAVAKGATATTSTLTLVKGTLKLMAWAKMKIAVVVGASVLLAASGGTAVYETMNAVTPARTDGPVDMRIKWMVGKKYSMHMELTQGTETKVPNQSQPVKSEVSLAQDFDISALKELSSGGWQLELKFVDETFDASQGGQKILSFDSIQNSSADPNNPAALLGVIIGARLQYFTDADGKVEKVEGVDDLMNRVATAGKPQTPGKALFNQLFGAGRLKQYVALGDWMPKRVVKVGERWSVKNNVDSPAVGTVAVDMQFNFKNWEQHGDHRCAHVEMTGDLSTKNISTATGAAISIEKASISGDFWFDPQLGMVVETDSEQNLTLKMTTQAQTLTPQLSQKTRVTLVDMQ
ncbi:MAG TPA: DUF6263 family protein [Verrucomicrobiae bacterium]|nr:DUF6263 family protein [Verrucomicrobiae bacterium]